MKTSQKKQLATMGEELAARYLARRGYEIVERNWRSGRLGEIDIIARERGANLVFVEVKSRSTKGQEFGIPILGYEAVDQKKRLHLHRTAFAYTQNCKVTFSRIRFDVIVILIEEEEQKNLENAQFSLNHIRNAFC